MTLLTAVTPPPPKTDAPSLAKAIFKRPEPYKHFLPLAQAGNPEDPIPMLTVHALAKTMAAARDESPPTLEALPVLFTYLSGLAKSTDAGLQEIAALEFSTLLVGRASRRWFWNQKKETVAPLIGILQTAAGFGVSSSSASVWSGNASNSGFEGPLSGGVGVQLLYHVLFVMWLLSFDSERIGDELNE